MRKLRERKERLRNIVDDSDLDSTTKSDLKNQINIGIIGSKYEIEKSVKKAIEKEKRKTELIELIENRNNSNLDSISISSLKNQVKIDGITNNIELEKAIEKEKRKTEMRKMVFEANINHNSKIRLLSKIKLKKINKNELEEEINFEKLKIESERKERICKKKLIEFAYNTNLSIKSKINLKNKINKGLIIDKKHLINEIQKEEEREITLKEKKLEEELLKKEKEQYERILFAKINNSGLDENLQKRLRRNVKNGKINDMESLNLEIKSLKKIHKIYF